MFEGKVCHTSSYGDMELFQVPIHNIAKRNLFLDRFFLLDVYMKRRPDYVTAHMDDINKAANNSGI